MFRHTALELEVLKVCSSVIGDEFGLGKAKRGPIIRIIPTLTKCTFTGTVNCHHTDMPTFRKSLRFDLHPTYPSEVWAVYFHLFFPPTIERQK
jgi:hypothetical protein